MNKKGDIAIVILVLGVLALLLFGLLSFYFVGEKIKTGKIDAAFELQGVYNIAESFKFSGDEFAETYNYITDNGDDFIVKTGFLDKDYEIFLVVNYKAKK